MSVRKLARTRVCVIGAGQAGMAALYYFTKLGDRLPEVTCYEKSATWGGQWNCRGKSEQVLKCHTREGQVTGMYPSMWINLPKEATELAHYTFQRHFGKNTPSYFTAPVMHGYLEGYWKSSTSDLSQLIRFNTAVTNVSYNANSNEFMVATKDLPSQSPNLPETFSHVIVACGIFHSPYVAEINGINTFPGDIIHSQQFQGGVAFREKRVLIVGSYFSAEDVATQCYKHDADHVVITWIEKPLGYRFPVRIEERHQLLEMSGNQARFQDGSTANVDTIVLCTGYQQSFPFLEDSLRITERRPSFYPNHLYKGMVWLNGGNNKLLYIGAIRNPIPIIMVDAQAAWAVRYITGNNPVHPEDTTKAGLNASEEKVQRYINRFKQKFAGAKDPEDALNANRDYVRNISDDTGYYTKIEEQSGILLKSMADRKAAVLDFRNYQYTSVYTGIKSTTPKIKWMDSFNDVVD